MRGARSPQRDGHPSLLSMAFEAIRVGVRSRIAVRPSPAVAQSAPPLGLTNMLRHSDGPGAVFEAFTNWAVARGLTPYPAQPEALIEVISGDAASVALHTARIDGGNVHRLSEPSTDGVYEDGYLRVAPDHHYLTFRRARIADRSSALFRVAPDGSHLRQLTPYSLRVEVSDLSTARHGPT